MASYSECGKLPGVVEGQAPQTGDATEPQASSESKLPAEFDHRGIRLPASTRVGGIIIPQ
jgi:hypothetical protein